MERSVTRSQYVFAERDQLSQSLVVCSQCGAQQWVDNAEFRSAIEKLCRKRGLQLAQYQVNVQARCDHYCGSHCIKAL